MAHVEEVRKKATEDKKLRIDHSDVYLENDRLSEELVYKKENISRKRHRQARNRDDEIKELRQTLSFLTIAKTVSAVNSLRPHTSPAYRSPSTMPTRRLKPPPAIVKLDVKVPSKHDNGDSEDTDNTHSNDDDSDSDDSNGDSDEDPERRRVRILRRQHERRMRPPSVMLRTRRTSGSSSKADSTTNGTTKKPNRQQALLSTLDMEAIPPSWYTEVHHPADIPQGRANSAHPAYRSLNTTTTSTRRPVGESAVKIRQRRAKSAFPGTSAHVQPEEVHDSALVCGGKQEQKKKESLSRRQILELTGGGKNVRPYSGVERHRGQFLEAVRLERERLETRVKGFMESCDRISRGGLVSSTKSRDFNSIVLPETFYV